MLFNPPDTNCHTFSDPISPSSVTYFIDGPYVVTLVSCYSCIGGFRVQTPNESLPAAKSKECLKIRPTSQTHEIPLEIFQASAAAETWRRVWGDGKIFRGPRFLNDVFSRKKCPFSRSKFLMTFF